MDAVIKIGGSLSGTPEALKTLGVKLSQLAKTHRFVVVPGGGAFADAVRILDAKFALPPATSHRMAILAMDQYGMLLSEIIPDSTATNSLQEAKRLSKKGKVAVFLPSKLLFQEDPFKPSWDVTSDSIAAYIAVKMNAAKAIFVTDVDGVYTSDPKADATAILQEMVSVGDLLKLGKRTSVDKFLPEFLKTNQLNCYVVNGTYPQRIEAIMLGQAGVCTQIIREFS